MEKNKKIQILQDIIKIDSVNDKETEVAKYLQNLLAEYAIDSELIEYAPNRSSIVAVLEGSRPGKTLGISGHLDVVAAGDEDEWTYPPFAAEIVDGKLYGRGATDMKSGLAALVIAMIEMKEDNVDFAGKIKLLGTVGEEVGMYGSKQLVDEGYADDLDGLIIGEPSSIKQIIYAHKGSIQYEIISTGRSAHSSMPELGIDALQQMVDYINISNPKYQALEDSAEHPALGRTINVNTVINGGDQINSVPAKVVLKANARIIPQADNDQFVAAINESLEEVNKSIEGKVELNMLQNNPPVESAQNNDLVESIRKAAGKDIKSISMAGATDASNFGRIDKDFDLAIFGPGELERSHIVDEYVEIDDYLNFVDIYRASYTDYLSH